MTTKKVTGLIMAILMAAALIFLPVLNASAQVTGPERAYYSTTLPAASAVPSGFSKNRDVLFIADGTSYKLNSSNQWIPYTPPWAGKPGPQGPQGPAGANGTCPDCPPASGSGTGDASRVTTWPQLIAALQNDNIRTVELGADITVAGKWRIPANYNRMKIIDGRGYRITVPASIDTFIVRSYPSLTAANSGIDMRLTIQNVDFKGSNNILVYLEATYGSTFRENNFSDFKIALDLRWCMGANIEHNYCWENYISFNLDYARFSGGGNAYSQCNHPYIAHNKYRSSAGAFANVRIIAASGVEIYHDIDEGVLNGPDFHYYLDDDNANVTWGWHLNAIHAENKAKTASIFMKQKQGLSGVNNYFGQYDNIIVKFETSGYAKCVISNLNYMTSGSKFQSTGGARWLFENPFPEFKITDATKWNGAIPSFTSLRGWDSADSQKGYMTGITLK